MTKTLTEQWREGTLTGGFYYIQLKDERWPLIDHTDYNLLSHKIEWKDFDWRAVEEVIEEVPCYEEYKDLYDSNKQLMSHIKTCEQQIERLQEQLDIVTEQRNDIHIDKQVLQKQLDEANEVIKTTNRLSGNIDLSQLVYENRRKIDGITMQTESYLEKCGIK